MIVGRTGFMSEKMAPLILTLTHLTNSSGIA
jgi:hypothetical protein